MNDEHDTNDAFLSPIEAYALRVKLRKAQARIAELEHKAEREHDQRIRVAKALLREKDNTRRIGELETRIRVLEDALTPFADACNDPDIASGQSNHTLYTLEWSEVGRRHVAILTSHSNLLEIGHLRAAYEALHGKPAPYLVDGGVWSDAPAGSGRGAYLPDPTISSGLRCPCHLEKTDAQDTPPEPE